MSAQVKTEKRIKADNSCVRSEHFDDEFYRDFYQDVENLDSDELIDHWITVGRKEARFPSDDDAVKFYILSMNLPSDFEVEEYLFLNPDIRSKFRWKYEAVLHFCEHGERENLSYRTGDDGDRKKSFDWWFYRTLNEDLAEFSRNELYEHWFKYGMAEKRRSNIEDYMQAKHGSHILSADFNVPSYININKDLIGQYSEYRAYLKHFLDYGFKEKRKHKSDTVDPYFVASMYNCEIDNLLTDQALHVIRTKKGYKSFEPVFLNESEMCNFYGFRDEGLLEIFDHDAYVHLNGEPTKHLDGCHRAVSLKEFLITGFDKAYNISFDHIFDSRFYALEYSSEISSVSHEFSALADEYTDDQTQTLYSHWIKKGISLGFHPNFSTLAKSVVGANLTKEIKKEIEGYQKIRNQTETTERPSVSLDLYIKSGWRHLPVRNSIHESSAGFFCGVALKNSLSGDRENAILLYQTVLAGTPGYPAALHQLGDEYLKSNFYNSAIECYLELIESNSAIEWTFLNCANCYERIGDIYRAAEILKKAREQYPSDNFIAQQEKELKLKQFDDSYIKARQLSQLDDVKGAQQIILKSLNFFEDAGAGEREIRKTNRVAIIANLDLPQCRFYRVEQKIELFEHDGYSVSLFGHTDNLDSFHADLELFEAVIFYRVPAFPNIINAINATNVEGIPSIYEIDDLVFDENEFPPPYDTYARQITKDQYNSLAVDTCLMGNAMQRCTYGMASTDFLASFMSTRVKSGQVFTLRNGLCSRHLDSMSKFIPSNDKQTVSVFYGSGTKAHKREFHEIIEPVLLKLKRKHGEKVKFLLVGSFETTETMEELGSSVKIIEQISNLDHYWALLAESADINLSILARSAITDSKSEIKWLEAGMFGIPSVVSRTCAYEECTIDGENIFLCDTKDEFFEKIDLLVENDSLRKTVGEKAKYSVLNNYDINCQAKSLSEFIDHAKKPVENNTAVSRKRVAIVNVFYPPEAIGGATRVVHDNVVALKSEFNNEFEIEVFCTTSGTEPYSIEKYINDNVRVTSVVCPAGRDHEMSDLKMQAAFSKFLDRFDPDIVHFHCIQRLTESIVSVTRSRKIPYLITAHDGWWVSDKQFLIGANDDVETYDYRKSMIDTITNGSSRQIILQAEIESAAAVLAVSEPFSEIYRDAGLNNVVTVENGLSPLESKPRTCSASGKVRLAHVGGMERHKGLYLVKNALIASPEIEDLELLVVNYAAKPGSYCEEVWGSTNVKIISKVHQSDVTDLYSQIDVLLAPSVWPESFGLVTREALYCGCWVVASDRGSIGKSIVEGENGHVVPVNTSENISMILKRINDDKSKYLRPPEFKTDIRKSDSQASDLRDIYKNIIVA